jgi:hypothetical protein
MVDMNRKMLSDLLIVIGLILAVIGWGGRNVGGWGSFVSYLMLGVGVALGILGCVRYLGGYHNPKE